MTRRRAIVIAAAVVTLAGIVWAPTLIAGRYADGPGGAEVGLARPDRGWEFLYHAVRLSRGARLGTEDDALVRARDVWAGSPVAESVDLVYQSDSFRVPVPPGGVQPPPARAVATPLSRLSWVVFAHVCGGPRQMIGMLDLPSGRVAWNIRPLPGCHR